MDADGNSLGSDVTDRICEKHGLVGVLVEYALLSLCQKNQHGRYADIGTFDKFMGVIYEADLLYGKRQRRKGKHPLVPLDFALTVPSITALRRDEVVRALQRERANGGGRAGLP